MHSVKQIPGNPGYIGCLRCHGEVLEGLGIPPIVDEETWRRVQVLQQGRRDARTREGTY